MKAADKKFKIAYVCPRYIPGTAGGAEVLIRQWAERMLGRGNLSEVLTTCARDHISWDNEYPPGVEVIDGVTVHRFPVNSRDAEQHAFYDRRITDAEEMSREEEIEWMKSGVNSDALCAYISDHRDEYDCFIFTPYLFGITYFGLNLVPDKSILVPCLHDEPVAYLKTTRDLFRKARGIFFNSNPEKELAGRITDLEGKMTKVVGLGVEAPSSPSGEAFRNKFEISSPYILYAGRREILKNTRLLIEYFRAFKNHQGTDLKLLFIGTGEIDLNKQDRDNIIDLGYLSEEDKWNAYAGALAFCQPSTNESFSIVLLEAFLAGTPGLVNAFCPVTLEHCLKSAGGFYFQDYFEFEESLLYLMDNPETAAAMGANGRRYVRDYFSWKDVLDRLEDGIADCLKI